MEKEKKSSLRERKAYCITYFIGEQGGYKYRERDRGSKKGAKDIENEKEGVKYRDRKEERDCVRTFNSKI